MWCGTWEKDLRSWIPLMLWVMWGDCLHCRVLGLSTLCKEHNHPWLAALDERLWTEVDCELEESASVQACVELKRLHQTRSDLFDCWVHCCKTYLKVLSASARLSREIAVAIEKSILKYTFPSDIPKQMHATMHLYLPRWFVSHFTSRFEPFSCLV